MEIIKSCLKHVPLMLSKLKALLGSIGLDWIGSWETSKSHCLSTHEGFKSKLETNSLEQNACFNTILVKIARLGCLCNFSYWRLISISFYIFTCMIRQCTKYSTIIPYNVSKNWINICQKFSQSQPPAKVTNSRWWLVAKSDTAY